MNSENRNDGNFNEELSDHRPIPLRSQGALRNHENDEAQNTVASRKMEKPAGNTKKTMEGDPAERQQDLLQRELRYWQHKLTEEELLRVAGRRDQLLAVLHEKYGYSPEKVKAEIEQGLLNDDLGNNDR
ncbi:MAG: hypothetical protein V4568_15145 [Pseudomonadota bacterium]